MKNAKNRTLTGKSALSQNTLSNGEDRSGERSSRELLNSCARYICDRLDRRDFLTEDIILGKIKTVRQMVRLLDMFIQRGTALQGEAILEDIGIVLAETADGH